MIRIRTLLHCLGRAAVNTVYHDGIEHAGYLAFLLLLALFPFLVLLVALAGFVGEGQAGNEFIALLFDSLPQHMVDALRPRVAEIVSGPPTGLLSVAILGAIWTASSAVEGFRTVLNRAYHVATPPAYILRRMLSVIQLLLFTFVLLTAMILIVATPIMLDKMEVFLGFEFITQDTVNWSNWIFYITVGVMLLMVANMYYALPNIKQTMASVLPGALITVALWFLAAKGLTMYLSEFRQVNLIYGSLGGMIAALLFFYVINVIFIYGAEFNYLLMKALGERIVQKEATPAEPVKKKCE